MDDLKKLYDRDTVAAELKALDPARQKEILEQVARSVTEDTTPEELVRGTKVAMTDLSPISDAWRDAVSSEKKKLEDAFVASNDRDTALRAIAESRVAQFGDTPVTTVKYQTNRDIYNALKDVYDKSGGDWDLVGKVIQYNEIPEDLVREFIKDGKWTDYSVGDESGSGFGAVARGATSELYGGLANILTGGDYARRFSDVVPAGLESEEDAKTKWRAGIRQAEGYGRSLMETDPAMEIAGQLLGMAVPLGVATKATKGLKVSQGATKLGRLANTAARSAAIGGLYSIPESLTKESVPEAVKNTALNAALFGTADVALAGLGAGLSATRRGAWKAIKRSVEPGENLTKSFTKLKPIAEMSEAERARGLKAGWLKEDGTLNVTDYLAKEHGMEATQTIDDLANVAKKNREVYNKLKSEIVDFEYKRALDKAATDALIPNAPLSRVNRLLKALPEKLAKFSDDIIGFTEEEGINLAQSMRAFNQQVKHELRAIRNPSAVEKRAIDQYLKDVETANMKQYMKKKLPSELKAVDAPKTVYSELSRIFQITNPLSALKAIGNVAQDQVERNYMRQIMAGEKYRPDTVRRLLKTIDVKK